MTLQTLFFAPRDPNILRVMVLQAEVDMGVWDHQNLTSTEDKALVRDQAHLDRKEIHATMKEEVYPLETEELPPMRETCCLLPTDLRYPGLPILAYKLPQMAHTVRIANIHPGGLRRAWTRF